jgi:hypothetical protein
VHAYLDDPAHASKWYAKIGDEDRYFPDAHAAMQAVQAHVLGPDCEDPPVFSW